MVAMAISYSLVFIHCYPHVISVTFTAIKFKVSRLALKSLDNPFFIRSSIFKPRDLVFFIFLPILVSMFLKIFNYSVPWRSLILFQIGISSN